MEREELDERIRELQAKAEAFFAQAGKDNIEVYRIEKFEPVRQDPQFLGKFYEGDSYVILKQNEKDYDIHYWHGKFASGDEQATAAAFTVQLSDNLPKASRHHLELMEEETQLFLSYFKAGIFYLPGGVESGFKHVEPVEYEHKLYHVKGKRYPRVSVKEMNAYSLNEGDVFILDLGMKLYFWPGKEANVNEKAKGMEIIFNIKNGERGAHPEIFYPRDGDSAVDAEFWEALGGKPDEINPAISDEGAEGGQGGDSVFNDEDMYYALYKVSNASGYLEVTEINERPLRRDHLDTNDTFILELHKKIYVWIGKASNLEEKKNGMKTAKDFIVSKGKNPKTQISRLPENGEDVHFKSFFNGFYPCIKQDFAAWKQLDGTTHDNQDLDKLSNQQRQAAKELFDTLQEYDMKVFHVDNGTPQELPQSEWGHFFADDLYIVDLKGKAHRYVLLWMGPKLNALQVTETSRFMDIVTNYENSNLITRQRVRKGHEEESLLSLFPEGFITYVGPREPIADKMIQFAYNGAMFRIQAPFGTSARAVQQPDILCQNLNSGDAYLVVAQGGASVYLWLGGGANPEEVELGRKMIQKFAQYGATNQLEFKEGEEPQEFWDALGGRTDYPTVKDSGIAAGFEPRLFQCSNASGYFFVSEIFNFSQDDLINDDIMLLDAYQTVYVWIGNKSNKFEMAGATRSAEQYIATIKDERDKENVQVVEIEAGKESPSFTIYFPEWHRVKAEKWVKEAPKEVMKANLFSGLQKKVTVIQEEAGKWLNPVENKFDLEVLLNSFPEGVDPTRKEAYLSEEQFTSWFKMSSEAFSQLKKWRQTELRKEKGLF